MTSMKNRRFIMLFILACSFLFLQACQPADNTPRPEPEPARETVVYVSGICDTADSSYPSYWKNGEMTELSSCTTPGGDWYAGYALSIFASGNDVYAAGYLRCHSKFVACYWKNGARTDLEHPQAGSHARTMHVSGADVYVAGWLEFEKYTIPCYWKNGERTDLSRVGPSMNDRAEGIFVSGGDIYVAGTINPSPGVDPYACDIVPCYWKNGERTDLNDGNFGYATAICAVQGKVYTAGYVAGGSFIIPCYWINGFRHDFSQRVPGYAYAIQVIQDVVHAAGIIFNEAGVWIPCQWKNGTRTDLEVSDPSQGGYAGSIFALGEDVFVAGYNNFSSYFKVPCYWKNGIRIDLKPGSYPGGSAHSVFVTYK